MAFREVTVLEVREVLRLSRDGVAKKRIARQIGLDVKTVRRYLELAQAAEVEPAGDLDASVATVVERLGVNRGRPRGEHWELCRAQRGFIDSHLSHGVRLTKIRRLLRRREVHVSYATLHRFAVEELGFGRRAPTIPVADCAPGEEVQLDTGRVGWLRRDDSGHRRHFKAWIFTAVRSRHRFVYPVLEETTATAIQACEAAWGFFGGVFKVVIPDNTKTIVNKADPLEPKLNGDFLEYAQSRGFHIDPTRVRSPKDKARVERAVQPVREDCYGGEELSSIEDALAHGITWCLEEYGQRRHSTTQRRPHEHFETEERPALLRAPDEPYDIPLWSKPTVGPDQHAQVHKALYSLPRRYRGRKLDARADRHTVRFYERKVLVKTHPRAATGKDSNQADIEPGGPLDQHHAAPAAQPGVARDHRERWAREPLPEVHRVRLRRSDAGSPLEEAVEAALRKVFVPEAAFAAARELPVVARYFNPMVLDREFEVQPLLTPDRDSRGRRTFMDFATRMIDKGTRTIFVENQSFNLLAENADEFERFFGLLKDKQQAGVDVRVIFRDAREFSSANGPKQQKLLEQLKDFGFNTDFIRVQRGCHTKGIIVDSTEVILGSHNLTNAGALLLLTCPETETRLERAFGVLVVDHDSRELPIRREIHDVPLPASHLPLA